MHPSIDPIAATGHNCPCMIPADDGVGMSLDKELKTYERELPSLLADEGKYVLIQGDAVVGTYASYEDAIKAGYEKFDLNPFLVKQIQAVEQIQCFSRPISLCHT